MHFKPISALLRAGIILLLLAGIQQQALAQSHYSFAGLQWGSDIESVEKLLTSQGFAGFSTVQKLGCKLKSVCDLEFSGPPITRGVVWFRSGKLSEVQVFPQNFEAALRALRLKYGEPLPTTDKSLFAGLTLYWRTVNGEGLSTFHESIVYKAQGPVSQDNTKF